MNSNYVLSLRSISALSADINKLSEIPEEVMFK